MTIKVGDRLPEGKLKVVTADGMQDVDVSQFFAARTVVLFAVPGAFTPTCDARHLPGYVEKAAALRAKGADAIACLSVNDAFVMKAWAKSAGCGDSVTMIADGNGDYTRSLGLTLDARAYGMGERSLRYAMIVRDGIVSQLNVEQGGDFKVSAAEYVLGQL